MSAYEAKDMMFKSGADQISHTLLVTCHHCKLDKHVISGISHVNEYLDTTPRHDK